MQTQALTQYELLFVLDYTQTRDLATAARAAGYRGATPMEEAMRLVSLPHVAEELRRRMPPPPPEAQPAATQDDVLERLWAIASVNVADLVQVSTGCCRFCWGEGHHYQRTPREHKLHLAAGGEPEGGAGYDPRKPPHADCPECFGEGVTHSKVADLAALPPAARALIRSIEVTKDGVKLRLDSSLRALELVGRTLGMFGGKPRKVDSPAERNARVESHIAAAQHWAGQEERKKAGLTEDELEAYHHEQDPHSIALTESLKGTPFKEQKPSPFVDDPTASYLREYFNRPEKRRPS